MREIKFRARNAEVPRCWVYGYFVQQWGTHYIVNDDGQFKVVAGTEGQYMEHKDKYGKEIYDGDCVRGNPDILGVKSLNEFRPRTASDIFIIHWNQHRARFGLVDVCGDSWPVCDNNRLELIGNRWDNPELLKDFG